MRNADQPAYPHLLKAGDVAKSEGGLSKREYFAAMAMQGFCAFHGDGQSFDMTEKESVVIADALLGALERTGGGS